MTLNNGDRVKHPTMPSWSIGQVLSRLDANTVKVFVGAGEKTISTEHVSLVAVTGAAAAHPLLDNLVHLTSAGTVGYRSLPESIELFLRRYPDGFYGRRYIEEERGYKVAAHQLCRDILAKPELTRLISTQAYDEAIGAALRIVNATNLIFPNEKMALRDGLVDRAARVRFTEALHLLLYGENPAEDRFLAFARVLESIGADKWTTASYFPFINNPKDFVFLKPTVTRNAAEICAFQISYRPELNWRTYDQVQAFARYLFREISPLKPRDMIDVQSFIWCIAPD